jgi:hypothetical protein
MFPILRGRNVSRRVAVLLSLSSLTLGGIVPGAVRASEGPIGWHNTQAFCDVTPEGTPQLWTAPSQIDSVIVSGLIGVDGVRLGNSHPQWATFRAHVLYSTDAQTWQVAASGSWFSAIVGDINTLDPAAWYSDTSKQWEWGRSVWDLKLPGYYRAAVEYYWWPSPQMADAGHTYEWANDHVDLTNPNLYTPNPEYCTVV